MVEPTGRPEEWCPSLSSKSRRSPLEIIGSHWMALDISPVESHRSTMKLDEVPGPLNYSKMRRRLMAASGTSFRREPATSSGVQ
jgi:hypothetical protein